MIFLKKMAWFAYPITILILLTLLSLYKDAHAGSIRKMELSSGKPGVIRLAYGRTTAVSFLSRPEKIIPGSPGSLEVNFLGKDVTLRPLSPRPGNILIYTKSDRYVIHLQITSDDQYDDVVEVVPSLRQSRIHLQEDAYQIASINITKKAIKNPRQILSETEVPVRLLTGNTKMESSELLEFLKSEKNIICQHCTLNKHLQTAKLDCSKPIESITCRSKDAQIELRRIN